MSYQLIQGDCLEVLPTLEAGSVDLCLTDPPYGTTACKWDAVIPFGPMWTGIKRVIKRNAAVVLFGSQPFTSALVMSNPKWFRYEWVWEKDRATGMLDCNKKPLKAHEQVIVFYDVLPTYNPQKTTGHAPINRPGRSRSDIAVYRPLRLVNNGGATDRYPRDVLRFNMPNGNERGLHPTQKPVALLEYLIRTYTNEGDTVLDFTCGSGSTGVAAVSTGRRFIGIEKDAHYFAIAQDRLEAASQQTRLAV